MKKYFVILLLPIFSLLLFSQERLTVYMPSNYYAWIKSLPTTIEFEKENHITIHFVSFDGSGKILSRLMLEKSNPKADVVMGLSQVSVIQANQNGLLCPYSSPNSKLISETMKPYILTYATPFDFGNLAILYNPTKVKNPPKTFQELAQGPYSFIMCDPRTSSTGEDFLLWSIAALGDNWPTFWKEAKKNIRYIAPSWDSAFAQFELGTAPMMVSYASDEAYSYYAYNTIRYKVIILSEGSYQEVEYNALINKKNPSPLAKAFIDLMLSQSVQSTVATNNWMMPATSVPLPDVYKKYYPISKRKLFLSQEQLEHSINSWISQWQSITLW